MAEPAVALSFRTDGASAETRARITRNVVAIAARPTFTPLDLAIVKLAPATPQPLTARVPAVRRAKPAGARNTIRNRFLSEATQELYDRLGKFERRRVRGAVILRWDFDEGDGIVVARMSRDETTGGETIGAQLDAVLRYCDAAERKPRIVVAVLNLSGQAHFDDRHDFAEVFEAFTRGDISWVAYKDVDRIARSIIWTGLLVYWLKEYGIKLHVSQLNREIDLHSHQDLLQLWILALSAEMELAKTAERTLTNLNRQMRNAGKGWGKSGGFGFMRDEHKFIVVNDAEWDLVLIIHREYARLQSYAALEEILDKEYNLHLGRGTLHKILHDKRYLTGEIRTKDPASEGGYRVDFVHIARPIPQAVWDHNQAILKVRRGKRTKTPEGQFVTRGIPVYHARCMDPDDPPRSTSQLRSVRKPSGKYRLTHHRGAGSADSDYHVPDSCRGWSVDVMVVERAVIRGVRTMLQDNDALHRAIALGRANREPTDDGGLFTADDKARLDREIRRLERYRDGLWQRHLDRIRKGKSSNRDFLDEELQVVESELASLQRQLSLDDQLRRRPTEPRRMPDEIDELLTDEPPDDPDHRLRRWAIVNELVSQVVVHDTDDGLSVELFGPLVPETDDAAAWDPLDACRAADDASPPRPNVPEPFRTRSSPERLVPAYRWRCAPVEAFAPEALTPELFVAAVRAACLRFPEGPVFAARGIGRDRWASIANTRDLPTEPGKVKDILAAFGTTPGTLIRDALGPEAITQGRLKHVKRRSEAVWVITTAILDGFSFEPGWSARSHAFGRNTTYPFNDVRLSTWEARFGNGAPRSLIEEALAQAQHLREQHPGR